MNTYEPSFELLAVMDERVSAWNTSRPDFKPGDLPFSEVKRMDLGLNSMCVYTIKVRSSVFFRDLMLSLRPIQCWAQSIRSAPLNHDTLRLSEEFAWHKEGEDNIDKMIQLHKNGVPRDRTRDMLPLTLSTTYTITIDHRILMAFCKSLLELNPALFDYYGKRILSALPNGFKEFDESTVQPAHPFLMITDSERINGTAELGNMVLGNYNMKCALAAQFLRQHYSKIKIGYWGLIDNYFNIKMLQSDSIEMVYYIDKLAYHRLMSMRSHWVLDWSHDMWGGMISDYIKNMTTEEFWNFLPNGAGKRDPYWADVYNRVLHKDPGIPCPIMCEWEETINLKELEVGESIVTQKYHALFDEGFIKDNPDNENRKTYLSIGDKR